MKVLVIIFRMVFIQWPVELVSMFVLIHCESGILIGMGRRREGKRREGKEREGRGVKGREGKGREGKRGEEKRREGKGRKGKRREFVSRGEVRSWKGMGRRAE